MSKNKDNAWIPANRLGMILWLDQFENTESIQELFHEIDVAEDYIRELQIDWVQWLRPKKYAK